MPQSLGHRICIVSPDSISIIFGSLDEGAKERFVALFSGHVFGMPLHAEAKAFFRNFDRLDHTVRGAGADHHVCADLACRLMMGAVDRE